MCVWEQVGTHMVRVFEGVCGWEALQFWRGVSLQLCRGAVTAAGLVAASAGWGPLFWGWLGVCVEGDRAPQGGLSML